MNDALNQTRLGDQSMIKEKFAGNWKPEDAAWYSAAGETDPKKKAEREQSVKRSQFEQVVTDSRLSPENGGASKWDKRANYDKPWNGSKEKKTFAWPWKKDATTKESTLAKSWEGRDKLSREGPKVAREGDDTSLMGDKSFATRDYNTRQPDIVKKEQVVASNPDRHRELNIIEDRNEPVEKPGWSVSDIRKFLNKH
jgi:hypothetical protein